MKKLLQLSENTREAMMLMTNTKTYSELITIVSFVDRFKYLKLDGTVGRETFGFQRWINQELYHSREWQRFRDKIIIRDNGCDLGVPGYEIHSTVLIHHLNPITADDILNRRICVFDSDNAICTSLATHNAIHYGDESLLVSFPVARSRNDTCPWKK